jgi:hypothetical protein
MGGGIEKGHSNNSAAASIPPLSRSDYFFDTRNVWMMINGNEYVYVENIMAVVLQHNRNIVVVLLCPVFPLWFHLILPIGRRRVPECGVDWGQSQR